MNSPATMTPTDITMLAAGLVLFVAAIGLLVFCVIKRRPFKALLVLFPLAIIMIGFPSIKTAKLPGLEFDEKTAADLASHPNDAGAANAYQLALSNLDRDRAARPNQPLPPQIQSNLETTANQLKNQRNLPPASRLALAHTFLILGQTNQARTDLDSAVKADTNLMRTMDPHLRLLLKPAIK